MEQGHEGRYDGDEGEAGEEGWCDGHGVRDKGAEGVVKRRWRDMVACWWFQGGMNPEYLALGVRRSEQRRLVLLDPPRNLKERIRKLVDFTDDC